MQHLNKTTTDGTQLNLDALYKICPSCFTETKSGDGSIKRAVDWLKLRSLLGDNIEDNEPEVYDFTWVGKRAAQREAAAPISKTLRPCPEESVDWDNTQNLYIEGDNLEVLKLLQNSYMGKVKMIYIDPPYNTGNDFVYHDDFSVSASEYDEHNLNENGERFRKNTDSNGRFHSDWCSMMYSRLLVSRSLLREDGIIFISIDDNEIDSLKKICDEVFGASNFVDIFNWAKTETPENLSKKCRQSIEYIIVYQKNYDNQRFKGIKKFSPSSNGLLNQPNAYGVLEFPANVVTTKIPNGLLKAGMYGTDKYDVELLNDVHIQDGVFAEKFKLRAKFKWQQQYLDNEIANGTRINIPTIKLSPSYEKTEYAPEVPTNLINNKVGVDTNETAGEYQLSLFKNKVFNFPKPISLIQYLFGFLDNPEEEYIVLDFFSGSATTAEAVVRLNIDRNKAIRYIMVQLQENLDESKSSMSSESQKEIIQNAITLCDELNKPHLLTEIAKERIRRFGIKIKEENPLTSQNLDTGFRVFKCDSSNFKDVKISPDEYSQEGLDAYLDNIKEDRSDLDLLFDCMLRWGVELSLPISKKMVGDCTIHNVNDGDLVACFNGIITEDIISAISEMNPLRVVFRDNSFEEASQKMNLFELFKQKCDWTDQEVMNNVKVI